MIQYFRFLNIFNIFAPRSARAGPSVAMVLAIFLMTVVETICLEMM